ncbi:MAG TPA: AAA family ATPase [Terriglobales bacterium]|nr:AAA family ATPase [Terriglobales bacterium]
MHGVAVALLAEDRDRMAVLQHRVEATTAARIVFTHASFPSASSDPILRQIQDLRAEVVVIDIEQSHAHRAINTIELLKNSTNDLAIFAFGDLEHPATIVAAMRAGACEYLDRSADSTPVQEALGRYLSSRARSINAAGRARVLTFMNAKGGSGATTLAVNTALALQQEHGATLLVDFATLGHAALHLNVRPVFGLVDALQNLHRMDAALLKGFITVCRRDLHLLAGVNQVTGLAPTTAELARLFDLLVSHYEYVVVDCSSRMDEISHMIADLSHEVLLVSQTDVAALWSTNRIRVWLDETGTDGKIRAVLNRYKKIAGFGEEDVQKATSCKVAWKVPNSYHPVASAIDRGEPLILHDSDLSRSIRGLAAMLAKNEEPMPGPRATESTERSKGAARLFISPLRAGQ